MPRNANTENSSLTSLDGNGILSNTERDVDNGIDTSENDNRVRESDNGEGDSTRGIVGNDRLDEVNPSNISNGETALEDSEIDAILRYKSSESYKINAMLMSSEELSTEWLEMIDNLDKALTKLPIYSGKVYRNLSFDDFGEKEEMMSFFVRTSSRKCCKR